MSSIIQFLMLSVFLGLFNIASYQIKPEELNRTEGWNKSQLTDVNKRLPEGSYQNKLEANSNNETTFLRTLDTKAHDTSKFTSQLIKSHDQCYGLNSSVRFKLNNLEIESNIHLLILPKDYYSFSTNRSNCYLVKSQHNYKSEPNDISKSDFLELDQSLAFGRDKPVTNSALILDQRAISKLIIQAKSYFDARAEIYNAKNIVGLLTFILLKLISMKFESKIE